MFPLTEGAQLPVAASPNTRRNVPSGYGVQEQCLPFTAASALGCLICSPISFGVCPLTEVPSDGRSFRSPIERAGSDGRFADLRVFYVKDDPDRSFSGNAHYLLEQLSPSSRSKKPQRLREPGISFFDREDQLDLFKLHLPYVWRTPPEVDSLIVPAINRDGCGMTVLTGLVETDWYANPVNLVIRKPAGELSAHVAVGDPIAQAIFIDRSHRRATIKAVPWHSRATREFRLRLHKWYEDRDQDRSAYKKLTRTLHGRVPE